MASKDQAEKQEPKPAAVIIIDDDDAEYVDVADMSCQATFEDIESETQAQRERDTDDALNAGPIDKTLMQPQTSHSDTSPSHLPVKSTAMVSSQQSPTSQTVTLSKSQPTVSRPSEITLSSASSTGKAPPVIYRTLKSPVTSGAPLLPQRVALKSSPPSLPVQQSIPSVKSSTGTVSSIVSPGEIRYL